MPAPNRSRYADDYGGGSSAVRTIGAFLLCAILSFALGFFVLARFWSSKPKGDAGNTDKNMVAEAGDRNPASHGDDTPTALRTSLPPAQPAPAPRVAAPRINPAEEVQQPASVDETKPTDAGTPSDENPAAKSPDDNAQTVNAVPADAPKTDETKPKKRRKTPKTDLEQAAKNPEEDTPRSVSTDDVNDVHAPKRTKRTTAETEAGSGLYRVQIGVYSTKEKAEEQVRLASEKGFESTVHTVTSGDRTLYRVQHSAHRSRTNAETEKQKLVDAGFDAYIANP